MSASRIFSGRAWGGFCQVQGIAIHYPGYLPADVAVRGGMGRQAEGTADKGACDAEGLHGRCILARDPNAGSFLSNHCRSVIR